MKNTIKKFSKLFIAISSTILLFVYVLVPGLSFFEDTAIVGGLIYATKELLSNE